MIRNRNPSNFPSCFHQASINFFQESSVVHDCTSSLEFVPRNKKLRNRHLEAKLHTIRGSNQTHRDSFISWKCNSFLNACNEAVDIVAHAAEAHKLDPLKVNFVIRFEILVRNNYVITWPEHPTPTPLFFERQNVICQYPIPRPSALSFEGQCHMSISGHSFHGPKNKYRYIQNTPVGSLFRFVCFRLWSLI